MGRIGDKFAQLKKESKKALITFVTAADPSLDRTIELVKIMEKKGADIIEIGIPYSDPIAEGPVIQKANERALKNNVKIVDIMNAVREMRKEVSVPLVFLLYYNCILQYGIKKFFNDCEKVGIDGLIIPDLPYEERDELDDFEKNIPIDIISMVSPTSENRIEKIARDAKGFLYCVSSLGVTGSRSSFDTNFEEFFKVIGRHKNIPTAIGFGISKPDHVRELKKYTDAVIVGSAIVEKIEKGKNLDDVLNEVGDFVRVLRDALDD